MEKSCPPVSCVLLNWNGWRDTVACLAALQCLEYSNLSIVVVDNGSDDGSVAHIAANFPDVLLLQTGRNLGFAGGNNVGIRHAMANGAVYVWLLNNDTVPDAHALQALVDKAQSDSRLGGVGSVLFYPHDPSKVQAWGGGRINLWIGRSHHTLVPRDDDWFHYITAASILLPSSALADIGLLDEKFFLYWEDGDLGFRLRKGGWLLGVAKNSKVFHKEHSSTGRNRRLIDRYVVASGIRFLGKHAPLPWVSIFLFLSSRLSWRLVTGQFRRIGDVTAGVRDYFVSVFHS